MESSSKLSPARQQASDFQDNKASTTSKPASSTPTSKYVRDFESLFVPINENKLRTQAQTGNLRHCQFRSLCWRYFLRCLPEKYDDWLDSCRESRKRYSEISAKHLSSIKPKAITCDNDDNLEKRQLNHDTSDDDQEFTKASKNCDYRNTFRTIERDVVRTFPDMEFFRQTEMQDILGNILFNFASENPHLSYKQGMHELLAILLYVAHTDSQNCLINYEGDYANEAIATLLDLKYLEHDVFDLFSALMKSIESWYQNDEILIVPDVASGSSGLSSPSGGRAFTDDAKTSTMAISTPKHHVSSVLGLKLKKISENIVRKYDSELYNHLEALQIAPQIYGIRWMRLLFGREYEFLDLLTVWDAIICDQDSMSLVDYVFASMLITIREELVNGDYTDCLNNLMRHQFKDVSYVIRLALYLRDPISNDRPRLNRQFVHQTKLASHHNLRQQSSATSSLTSKLSQQYLSDRLKLDDSSDNKNYQQPQTNYQIPGSQRFVPMSSHKSASIEFSRSNNDCSDRRIFSMTYRDKQQFNSSEDDTKLSGGFLAKNTAKNDRTLVAASGSKFLPNINKIVSSVGQNIQDKATANGEMSPYLLGKRGVGNDQRSMAYYNKRHPAFSNQSRPSGSNSQLQQHYRQLPTGDLILSAGNHRQMKEYEMREMQSIGTQSSAIGNRNKLHLSQISSGTPGGSLDVSSESCEDLHTIVDYCWRLLSKQIDSLQRCLPKEKSLHCEDEIFVALAQLKKVRDVLKGSLRLEDELESTTATLAALDEN